MSETILVYDIGTTSVKSAMFDFQGNMLFSVHVPYSTHYPKPGWSQQNPEEYWSAVVKGTAALRSHPSWQKCAIEAISLTGHMNGTLCVDNEGRSVYPQIIHSDTRSISQVETILSLTPAEEIYRESGNRMNEFLSLPKLLWIKEREPEAFSRCRYVLNAKDYVRSRLTGVWGTTDFSDASLTGAFSMKRHGWNQELIEAVGLSAGIFPDIHPSFHVDGYLNEDTSRILDIPSGIPVATGAGDAACATRGAMVQEGGESYISLGSSSWLSVLAESPVHDPLMRMQQFYDLDAESINVCGTTQSAGTTADWAREHLNRTENVDEIEERLASLPIGNHLIALPYLMGERTPHWDPHARGALMGLSLTTTSEEMIRSWYESVTFALYSIYRIYDELKLKPDRLSVIGGGARSGFWLSMVADVFGLKIQRHPFPLHAASYGASLAGAVAAGAYSTISEAVRATRREGTDILPRQDNHRQYMKYYTLFTRMYEALRPLYRELTEIG